MPINLNGNIGSIYLGSSKISEIYKGSTKIYSIAAPVLPANTLRFRFTDPSYTPVDGTTSSIGTWSAVNASNGIWDWYCNATDWSSAFANKLSTSVLGPLGSNNVSLIAAGDTSSVTNMYFLFMGCNSLNSVVLFDTSNVTSFQSMFYLCSGLTTNIPNFDLSSSNNIVRMFQGCVNIISLPAFTLKTSQQDVNANYMCWNCTSLKNVPLFNMSGVSSMTSMFDGCTSVESGAYDLYVEANNKLVSSYQYAFRNCGSGTTTGAADLARIPSSWK